jgi:hypothetical protein
MHAAAAAPAAPKASPAATAGGLLDGDMAGLVSLDTLSLGNKSCACLGLLVCPPSQALWPCSLPSPTLPAKPFFKPYEDTYYIIEVPSQRWNNVVFNYYDNKVDLWINGILERNMDLQNNPLTHLPTDVITLGSNNGLMGGICNIQFFDKPMTMTQITQSYNFLYSRNPPVNNL